MKKEQSLEEMLRRLEVLKAKWSSKWDDLSWHDISKDIAWLENLE